MTATYDTPGSAKTLIPGSQPHADLKWPVSLLWPSGEVHAGKRLDPSVVSDLALDHIIRAMDTDGRHDRVIRSTLTELITDPATIEYRQQTLADLLALPVLCTALRELLPHLGALGEPTGASWRGESPLMLVMRRLDELDAYVACVDRLNAILQDAQGLRSPGLLALKAGVQWLAESAEVRALRAELPGMREMVGEAKSVTVGINLDPGLHPESATIVSLNNYAFKGPRSLLGRLLPDAASAGQTALHHVGPAILRRESPLFKDLTRMLEKATEPLAKALARHRDTNVGPIAALEKDLRFFTGAAAFLTGLQRAGVAICRPEIAPLEERVFDVTDLVNGAFALQTIARDKSPLAGRIVPNDAYFGPGARLLILTGPNRGGKTTYCRAIGQAQVLFGCGLYVPGARASISPVDGIWTHFPLPETDLPGAGRLDEEVKRLRQIFNEATADSLILLNEPLTSTSERGAMRIATDLVRAFRLLDARVMLVTHLHDLALSIPELNEAGPGDGDIRSLVAQAMDTEEGVRSTFRIVAGAPAGQSHAVEIARQHGLTFEHLQLLLSTRTESSRTNNNSE